MAKDSFKPLETIVGKELSEIADMKEQFETQIHGVSAASTQGVFLDKVGKDERAELTKEVLSRIQEIVDCHQAELRDILSKATKSKDGKEMNRLYRKASHHPLISFNRDKDNEKRVASQVLYDRAIADAQNEVSRQTRMVVSKAESELHDAAESFKKAISSMCSTTVARVKEKEALLEKFKGEPVIYIIRGSYNEGFSVTQLLGTEEIGEYISANREELLFEAPETWEFRSFPELLECWRTMNEDAYNTGYKVGESDGYASGYSNGYDSGYSDGYSSGCSDSSD